MKIYIEPIITSNHFISYSIVLEFFELYIFEGLAHYRLTQALFLFLTFDIEFGAQMSPRVQFIGVYILRKPSGLKVRG